MISDTKTSVFSGIKIALNECLAAFKQGGIKAVIKRYGWKTFAAFFIYYLVRDLILYVLIPALFARHFLL